MSRSRTAANTRWISAAEVVNRLAPRPLPWLCEQPAGAFWGSARASRRPEQGADGHPTELDGSQDITPLARNEFIGWVEDAKQEMTQERCIRRTQDEQGDVAAMLIGNGLGAGHGLLRYLALLPCGVPGTGFSFETSLTTSPLVTAELFQAPFSPCAGWKSCPQPREIRCCDR
jgi:hypothetical protein